MRMRTTSSSRALPPRSSTVSCRAFSRLARTRVANLKSISVAVLRVWGGGMFLPDAFYDACDEFGIMLYHDMQYAQEGHSPRVGTPQDPELRYQIRRLSSHPSVAIVRRRRFSIWSRLRVSLTCKGCNVAVGWMQRVPGTIEHANGHLRVVCHDCGRRGRREPCDLAVLPGTRLGLRRRETHCSSRPRCPARAAHPEGTHSGNPRTVPARERIPGNQRRQRHERARVPLAHPHPDQPERDGSFAAEHFRKRVRLHRDELIRVHVAAAQAGALGPPRRAAGRQLLHLVGPRVSWRQPDVPSQLPV